MNLALWLHRAAQRWPDAPALFSGENLLASYQQWERQVAQLAAHLRGEIGLRAGDRAAIFLPNTPDYLTIIYTCWYVGAVVVPVNIKLHPRELAWIVGNAEAGTVFTDAAHKPMIDSALAEIDTLSTVLVDTDLPTMMRDGSVAVPESRSSGDIAWLFYTSGTTGKPKGVMMTHGNLAAMAFAYLADVDDVSRDDAALYAAPISHGAGIYNLMHVLRGARHIVPQSGGFDPDEIITLAPKLGYVHMFAAPTMVTRLLSVARTAGYRGDGIRTIVYGGGPMYLADIADAMDWFGPRFVQIYGQGECPMAITALSRKELADRSHPRWAERAASVGRAQSRGQRCCLA